MKRCRGPCGELWPIECFGRDRANPDGRRNECTACRQERRAELKRGAARRRPWDRKFERGYRYRSDWAKRTRVPGRAA